MKERRKESDLSRKVSLVVSLKFRARFFLVDGSSWKVNGNWKMCSSELSIASKPDDRLMNIDVPSVRSFWINYKQFRLRIQQPRLPTNCRLWMLPGDGWFHLDRRITIILIIYASSFFLNNIEDVLRIKEIVLESLFKINQYQNINRGKMILRHAAG